MIAICIGHSRKIGSRYDGGAYSPWLKTNERDFNTQVGNKLAAYLAMNGIKSRVITHYDGAGYGSAMQSAADQIKAINATLAIELHFNSATPSATGHEWLYWHSSAKGKAIAEQFSEQFSKDFPNIKSRGLKGIDKSGRGGLFLRYTHCPAIITEPFFGSNENDCRQVSIDSLAKSYAKAIIEAI